jgi:hypothetical protein
VDWWERKQKKRRELAQGVDADLVRDNRRRWLCSSGLLGLGFLLLFVRHKVAAPSPFRPILTALAVVTLIIGVVLNEWARWEHRFLRAPDPEEPPSILKE